MKSRLMWYLVTKEYFYVILVSGCIILHLKVDLKFKRTRFRSGASTCGSISAACARCGTLDLAKVEPPAFYVFLSYPPSNAGDISMGTLLVWYSTDDIFFVWETRIYIILTRVTGVYNLATVPWEFLLFVPQNSGPSLFKNTML